MNTSTHAKIKKAILKGMEVSSAKLIAQKKKAGTKIVINEDGVIKEIEAKDWPIR